MKGSTLLAMLLIAACIVIGFATTSCESKSGHLVRAKSNAIATQTAQWNAYLKVARPFKEQLELSRLAQLDTVKWNAFLECSKDEGDMGCDSCFKKIYGFSLEFK